MTDCPYPDNPGQTHFDGCERTARHHNCALRRLDEAIRERDALAAQVAALREPLATALMHIPAYYAERAAWEAALSDTEAAAAALRAEVEARAVLRHVLERVPELLKASQADALEDAASSWDFEFFDLYPESRPDPATWLLARADEKRGGPDDRGKGPRRDVVLRGAR